DVRGGASAFVSNINLDSGGDVTVDALESAAIRARFNSTVTSTKGAGNILVATNMVLSDATAYVEGSDVATTNLGDVSVTAQNTSLINAKIVSDATSKRASIG